MGAYLKEIGTDNPRMHCICMNKSYFLIGRHEANDINIRVATVSRFNCFIVHHSINNCLYLFSSSANKNVYFNPRINDFSSEKSRLDSSLDTLQKIGASSSANELENEKNKMGNIPGYKKGEFKTFEDFQTTLVKLEDTEYLDYCIRRGAVRLTNKSFIGVYSKEKMFTYQLVIEMGAEPSTNHGHFTKDNN
ncbi:hypothetical protein [Candidatus Uabimicrobium sp. HlEnr_7]|uniref:hypothetical protein n=1 Tax=Candidatus Uabimicrobium helgolandensis TaxID=3095367 RepID=UPI0035579520